LLAGCGSLFGSSASTSSEDIQGGATEASTPQLGVNGFLWRASLDTLHFMPLKSADQVGGVIITDWYAEPANPNEQMKVTVYISDRRLRADAVKVSVFRQIRSANGWVDAQVNADTASKLENAILARARQLRIASADAD
jgi:hypothetical protein